MSEAPYERYRDALRRGHIAARDGDRAAAVEAYREAGSILSGRAVPHIGEGRVELAHGDAAAALRAFDAAIGAEPASAPAIDGRVAALLALGRPSDAADALDRLAIVLEETGANEGALEAAERAAGHDETADRRATVARLRGKAVAHGTQPVHALWQVDPNVRALAEDVESAAANGDHHAAIRAALALAAVGRTRAALDACHDALTIAPDDPAVHGALAEIYRRRGWDDAAADKDRLIERFQAVLDHPAELDRLAYAAEAASDSAGLVDVVERHARQGRLTSAMDVALTALTVAPGDPGVHLAIAAVQLRSGWRPEAIDGVTRLARLVELIDDAPARERIAAFVATQLAPDGSARP